MGYIHKQHKQITLNVLREARKQIDTDEKRLICTALLAIRYLPHMATPDPHLLFYITRRISEYIADSLGDTIPAYDWWLERKLGREVTPEECKRGRLAWLDRMIQEVENA